MDQPGEQATDEYILEWAHQVRGVLKASGPMPLAGVARRITDATTNEVAMAAGWLAREGEIRFSRHGGLWEIAIQAPSQGKVPTPLPPERRQKDDSEDIGQH